MKNKKEIYDVDFRKMIILICILIFTREVHIYSSPAMSSSVDNMLLKFSFKIEQIVVILKQYKCNSVLFID